MTSQQFAIAAGGAVLLLLLIPGTGLAQQRLSLGEVKNLADTVNREYFPNVDPVMATTIAKIESNFRPGATREEPGDRQSTGLMQTLHGTALDMASRGHNVFPLERIERLKVPITSMYYGQAYLSFLSRYKGQPRSEEWIVKSYNGGPGADNAAVNRYYERYLKAKQDIERRLNNAADST